MNFNCKIFLFGISLLVFSNITNAQFDFFEAKTTVGGYGELHYNYAKPENGSTSQTLDFHRFVMFYSHAWSEQWSFKAEVELEHNFVSDDEGELELEQAYVNYHHSHEFGFQVGVILPSVGLINETHEPPTFLSVERPTYHSLIIPTTWYGNGIAFYGNLNGIEYKAVIMEGLDADGFSKSNGIRGGRLKGFKADAENLLYNVRVNYLNIPGVILGGSFTYNNAKGDSINNAINLIEFHARYRLSNFYVDAELGNISYAKGNLQSSFGYYLDLGYNISNHFKLDTKIIPFIRYSNTNTAAKTKIGGDEEKLNHATQIMFGLAILPIEQVVFKMDYSQTKLELTNAQTNYFNIGVGYMF